MTEISETILMSGQNLNAVATNNLAGEIQHDRVSSLQTVIIILMAVIGLVFFAGGGWLLYEKHRAPDHHQINKFSNTSVF